MSRVFPKLGVAPRDGVCEKGLRHRATAACVLLVKNFAAKREEVNQEARRLPHTTPIGFWLTTLRSVGLVMGRYEARNFAPNHISNVSKHSVMPHSDAWIDFLAGWCSGAVAVVAIQPVDTVLTRYQAGLQQSNTYLSMTRSLTNSAGLLALWRGSSPMITAVPLQNALLMGGYGVGQRYAQDLAPQQRYAAIFIGGTTGGIQQSFLMSPVELVKVHQQVDVASIRQAVTKSKQWQRGLGATLLRDGIPHGVWFVTYEMTKDRLSQSWSDNAVAVPLLSGAWAATVAWAVGYPADVIKTRIQAGATTGIVETAQALVREANGSVVVGLYQGFWLKLVRSIPASMIGFTVYETVKSYIEEL